MDMLYRETPQGGRRYRVIHTSQGQVYCGDGAAVGLPADWRVAPPRPGTPPETVIAALRQRAAAEGYAPPPDEEVHTLVIQLPLDGTAPEVRKQAIAQTLSAVLVGRGFGTLDGEDRGSGKVTLWTHVIEPERAAAACVQALQAADQLQGVVLVSVAPDDDGTPTPRWPEGYDPEQLSVL